MTSTQPRSVAELSAEVLALGARLNQVGLELRAATPTQAPLATARPVPPQPGPLQRAPGPPAPVRPRPVQPVAPRPMGPPSAGAWRPGPPPAAPHTGARPPQPAQPPRPPVPPVPPAPPRPPWWQREGAASRVLAVAGSVVTLLGVVMLLVLAVQRGYLGPVPRVVGGAVLAAVLVGLGARVRGRAGGRVGAVALAGTGFAGLHLDVVAATAGYAWLPVAVGLALTLSVAAAGVALADRWTAEPLALLAVGGAAVLGPVVAGRVDLLTVGFLLVLQAAALPSALRRGWRVLPVLSAVAPLLGALVTAGRAHVGDLPVTEAVLAAGLVSLVGLAAAVATQRVRPADVLATPAIVGSAVPVLVVALVTERLTGALLAAGLAAVLLLVAVTVRWLTGPARVVLGGAAALAVLQASLLALDGASRPALLLGEALVLLAAAHRLRSLALLRVAAGFAGIGALAALAVLPPDALTRAGGPLGVASLAAGVLLAVTAVALAAEVRHSRQVRDLRPVWVLTGVAALHGLTGALVSAAVLALGPDGFVLGHTAATVTWTAIALGLLAVGLRRGATATTARVAGLVLAAAAVAKLLLFDLAALDGIYRVVAFLVVGLLLLTAGTRYARMLGAAAEAEPRG